MDEIVFEEILEEHTKWLSDDEDGGRCADLRSKDLRNIDLSDVNLSHALLGNVILTDVNLCNTNLSQTDLTEASLNKANLSNANLSYADLTKATLEGTDLTGTDLTGTNLSEVDLGNTNLREAYLDGIKADLFDVLDCAPQEVRGLLQALEEGRVDGETYSGDCCCLIGTIAEVRGCSFKQLENITPNVDRPIEVWFFSILKGDTPESSIVAAITAEWINDWLAHGSTPREEMRRETEANL